MPQRAHSPASAPRPVGTSLAVSELCVYLAPYRQPRACFDITQSFAPGRRSTACEVKRVYVYGFHAGASGGMCRDVIVVGGNRAAQQGVLAQGDPPDCENHVFEEVNADVGSTLDAGLAVRARARPCRSSWATRAGRCAAPSAWP